MKRIFALLFCFLCASRIVCAQENEVPLWFRSDAEKPYKVFDAWKSLSTREAALYWNGLPLEVLAGQLRDAQGKPVPHASLNISYNDIIRGYDSRLATDDKGYFVIYSPYSLNARPTWEEVHEKKLDPHRANYGDVGFSAVIGYPNSVEGWEYAEVQKAIQPCRAQKLLDEKDRAFYVLTLEGQSKPFNQASFGTWKAGAKERWDNTHTRQVPSAPVFSTNEEVEAKHRKRLEELKASNYIIEPDRKATFQVRVLSFDKRGVADAVVSFFSGNDAVNVARTDKEGRCQLSKYVIVGRDREYYEQLQRDRRKVGVFAKGYGSGPVDLWLQEGKENIITLQKPAAARGKLVDSKGNLIYSGVMMSYQKNMMFGFINNITIEPDGTFSLDNIMPNEPFKFKCEGFSEQNTPTATYETPWMTLKPGKTRNNIVLTIPQAAAIRGIVIDETGKVMEKLWNIFLMSEDGNGRGAGEKGEFGFSAIGQQPIRVEVQAEGKQKYVSDWMRLQPGEMRFLKIVMKPQVQP